MGVLPFVILGLLGLLVPAAILIIAWALDRFQGRPVVASGAKGEPYECGLGATVGGAGGRFSVHFYLIAMLFLVFDIEVAFLYPLVVAYTDLPGWWPFLLMFSFLLLLEAGYLYLFRKGALDWER